MSKSLIALAALLLALALLTAGASAGHDLDDVSSDNIRITGRHQFPYGTDIAFRRQIAVAGAGNWDGTFPTGIRILNIANPQKPQLLSYTPCIGWHTDVGITKNVVVASHDSAGSNEGCYEGDPNAGKEGVLVLDATDLGAPVPAGFAETIHGSHNLTTVGDTGLVYVSSYNLLDATDIDGVSIVDVADPYNPTVRFLEFPGLDASGGHPVMENKSGTLSLSPGCHDISVHLDRSLAFCAGIHETQIWDISDAHNPKIIEIIHNPLINIHHAAAPNRAGDILILGDEHAGAAGGPTACLVPEDTTGALWFYDISDPRNPVLLSWWSPPMPAPTDDFCTSHFYGVFPDRDYVVSAWYDLGIWVVDFSDPTNPTLIANYDPAGATFWSAYAHNGYIYANSFAPATLDSHDPSHEHAGGLYVFELDGYTRSDRR